MKLFQRIMLLAIAGLTVGAQAEISGSGHQIMGCDGKIRSRVWNDANDNGVQDAGEPALGNVIVALSLRNDPDEGEDLLHSDGDGNVLFFNLCLRSYLLRIEATSLPVGMSPTIIVAGPEQNHVLDSDATEDLEPVRIDLHENHVVEETVDFGFKRDDCGASIGDLVWLDDGNGLQDENETGLANIAVDLHSSTGELIDGAVTDAAGRYLFANVCDGAYLVSVDSSQATLEGLTPTAPMQGADPAADSNLPADGSAAVYFVDGDADMTLDFGLVNPACTGTLSGEVFLDDDGDGARDAGESGIEGVELAAIDETDTGHGTHTTVTNSDGAYRFDGLCAGTYAVSADESTLPPDAGPTHDMSGMSAVYLPDNSSQVSVGAAGFTGFCGSEIGDRIWLDANADGVQSAGEPGVPDVTVVLRDALGNPAGSATSDGNGAYRFHGLCAGDYAVQVDATTLPQGALPTLAGGAGPALDSDGPAPAWLTLENAATVVDDIDFGFVVDRCVLGLDAGCIVMTTAPRWDHCHDPEELTMIWDGVEPVRVVAHQGDTSKAVVADIDNVAPGAVVSVSVEGAPNDLIWEIFRAGTSDKLGESSFHISCSDQSMDGPEDCGTRQGDGKNGDRCDGACLNDWLLEGVVDKHGAAVSLSCTLGETPAAATCAPLAGELVSYRYRVTNLGLTSVANIAVSDSQSGMLGDSSSAALPPGGSRTYVANAAHDAALTNHVAVNGNDELHSCSVSESVNINIAPPPPCAVSGESMLDLSHDKFKWQLTNPGPDPATITAVSLSWPAQNEELKEVKLGGDKIFDDLRPPTSASLTQVDFEPDESKRIIDADKTEELEVKFTTHHHGNQQETDYQITVDFAEGCSVSFAVN